MLHKCTLGRSQLQLSNCSPLTHKHLTTAKKSLNHVSPSSTLAKAASVDLGACLLLAVECVGLVRRWAT